MKRQELIGKRCIVLIDTSLISQGIKKHSIFNIQYSIFNNQCSRLTEFPFYYYSDTTKKDYNLNIEY